MARTVPGSGAVIKPIFDKFFGVRAVSIVNSGSGYDPADPPRLTITGCGIPEEEALLYPIIDSDSGKIIHVRVLERGRGYDPLRLQIIPTSDSAGVIDSFDINKIWQSHPNSTTTGEFQVDEAGNLVDRLRIQSDNDPKPADIIEERQGGPGLILDRNFDQTFIYRGGKQVPFGQNRTFQKNKALGIMANGVLLHTPEWGSDAGGAPVGFELDSVANKNVKRSDPFDGAIDNNTYYYQSSRLIEHFKLKHGPLDWGIHKVFVWRTKVEFDNILIDVTNVDETLGSVEIGRTLIKIGGEQSGEIVKIIRNNLNRITQIYLRDVNGTFEEDDEILGSNGFTFTISNPPRTFPAGIFYIDFGPESAEFGPFIPGRYYFAPENIRVQRNYVIIWDQSDITNQPNAQFPNGHPMQFSTTQDGILNQNGGELYLNSTGDSNALGADYENRFRPIFIMNEDEESRIYYYCQYHQHMSGYTGHEGYMVLDPTIDNDSSPNDYYVGEYFKGAVTIEPDEILSQYNGQFLRVSVVDSGLGTSSNNGFNIGRHIRFGTSNANRHVRLTLDLRDVFTLNLEVIRGNSANGGEQPDYGEDLRIFFSGTVYGSSVVAAYYDNSFTSLRTVTVSIPPDVRRENQIVYIYQANSSGSTFDHYGLKSITFGGGEDDFSRHPDGHSKILGMSFDGYPIYGPFGYFGQNNAVQKATSSYRYKVGVEIDGARPEVTTAETITYTVTTSAGQGGQFLYDGSVPNFLNLKRGKTYIFNQDDSSNDGNILLLSEAVDGWHPTQDVGDVGNLVYLYRHPDLKFYLNGLEVTYENYIDNFTTSATRELRFEIASDVPRLLYTYSYANAEYGIRSIQDGYLMGHLYQDYIYDETVGTLDEFNGAYVTTPEYPNGTYAYFLTEDSEGNPTFPYCIGSQFFGAPLFEGDIVPDLISEFPSGAEGDVILNENGEVSYVKMTKNGDGYFTPAEARILGGEGSGAIATPVVQTVTGLTLLNEGRSFASPPTLIFEGGGGQGAQGAAEVSNLGKISRIDVVDQGDFYQEPPYIYITGGGGIGARAVARIDQGKVVGIDITEPGNGYINPPNIIFTKLVNLKRKSRARQAFNSTIQYLTGLVTNVGAADNTIYVDSTDAFPGSGNFVLNNEIIAYTGKSRGRFTGLTRGTNFNYDQRVILDTTQDVAGVSSYQFNVGDRLIRRVESANNKVARVYDWNPNTRELFVTFEIDELAFIDGGIASTEDAIVQFDAGIAETAGTGFAPHTVIVSEGDELALLQANGIVILQDRAFQDIAENDGAGDGIPDLINVGTGYEGQINLDGGIYNSLYGIEETQGGQNTTLFQVGDSVLDATPYPEQKFATIIGAGGLSEGVEHVSLITITLDKLDGNGRNYGVNEIVTGDISGVRGTVVSWDSQSGVLVVKDVVPYNTGNVNIGVNGYLYEFSSTSTIVDIVIQDPGTNYSALPSIAIESSGDIQATAVPVMTTAGDQVSSLTITNGGYGYVQNVDGSSVLHPTITFNNDPGDTTGAGATAYAVLGGEKLAGNAGASYRIKSVSYQTVVQTS
ncbi:hypothetical protein RW01021201_087 [Synechococcus phage S-RIM8]|uniref:YHYH domain-containing protein n=1 Tax=Synechococcus phage S-RIM8 TaxID=756278 RepID=A0A1D7S990_9CAUD|nr:hypothetical protein RW01021201_087 [Synechococcus phage S-RIM8]QBQ75415.1 hypothetical protein RW030617_087 [Synechococcus phage S-RIM8]